MAPSRMKIPNPLDYVDGKALGRHLRHNDVPSVGTPKVPTQRLAPAPKKKLRKSNIPRNKI